MSRVGAGAGRTEEGMARNGAGGGRGKCSKEIEGNFFRIPKLEMEGWAAWSIFCILLLFHSSPAQTP